MQTSTNDTTCDIIVVSPNGDVIGATPTSNSPGVFPRRATARQQRKRLQTLVDKDPV